jgi:hypothetical protein
MAKTELPPVMVTVRVAAMLAMVLQLMRQLRLVAAYLMDALRGNLVRQLFHCSSMRIVAMTHLSMLRRVAAMLLITGLGLET